MTYSVRLHVKRLVHKVQGKLCKMLTVGMNGDKWGVTLLFKNLKRTVSWEKV